MSKRGIKRIKRNFGEGLLLFWSTNLTHYSDIRAGQATLHHHSMHNISNCKHSKFQCNLDEFVSAIFKVFLPYSTKSVSKTQYLRDQRDQLFLYFGFIARRQDKTRYIVQKR